MPELNFDAVFAYLTTAIDRELEGRPTVAPGYLKEAVERLAHVFNPSEPEKDRLVKHLETVYGTKQENGSVLIDTNFKEWYPKARQEISFYYWRRLEKFWRDRTVLPKDVVRSVDDVTDEIMGYLGNPADLSSWNRRRGLVMGHVQMGKTTNYSALISKAADAGYRIIIVLAGMTNSLRQQTQIRLDKTFVGRSSVSDSTSAQIYDVARVFMGTSNVRVRYPYCGTTQIADFSVNHARAVGAHEGNFADPILFVIKKNPQVLETLVDWLRGLRPGELLDGPLLLIDDEADNASVNTAGNSAEATKINKCIRDLIHTTKHSSYVGYTATPFANIFIDPDSTDSWEREDLFPADFIKSLDPPDNYVGAHRLFSGDLVDPCLRMIPEDYQDILPLKHKSTDIIELLPCSLRKAIQEYVLFRAIRIASGHGDSHTAMLINVSRFNNVQSQVVGVSRGRAFVTGANGVGMIDLGSLNRNGIRLATAINDSGQVVGYSTSSIRPFTIDRQAFITGANGVGMTGLGTLGGRTSEAYDINNSGQVVGASAIMQGHSTYHAFVTAPNGIGMTDLNSLLSLPDGAYFDIALGINDAGQIIATASNLRGYLLTPVPEPETYAMMLAGLGLLGFAARRKKMKLAA